MFDQGQWIFYLEAALALAILVGIVWWTMGARHKPDKSDKPPNE